MKKTILFGLLICLLLLSACSSTSVGSSEDYEGTWSRQGTYVSGSQVSSASATMILTKNTFDSSTSECGNSGSISVTENTMVMTVEESDCPSIINVGSVVTSTYSVSGTQLTLTNNDYGAEVKEIYNK